MEVSCYHTVDLVENKIRGSDVRSLRQSHQIGKRKADRKQEREKHTPRMILATPMLLQCSQECPN